MLPNHGQPRPQIIPDGRSVKVHVPQVAEHMLPSTVDWRRTGAESPIKDQAACGSCWVSRAWLEACCKGLWGGGLLQCDRSFRLRCLSGPLIRQQGPCKPSCSALRTCRDQCAEPQAACRFCWVSWGALAFWMCL